MASLAKEAGAQLPKVESLVDALGPKLEMRYWHILFAPAGTPAPVLDKLNGALRAALDDPRVVQHLGADRHQGLSGQRTLAGGSRKIFPQRDRALGRSDPREQDRAAAAVRGGFARKGGRTMRRVGFAFGFAVAAAWAPPPRQRRKTIRSGR